MPYSMTRNNHKIGSYWILAVSLIPVLLFSFAAQGFSAADHDGLSEAEAATCFECHEELGTVNKGETIHPPFEEGECLSCHELAADNTFKTVETGAELCAMCHDAKGTMAAVHEPVAAGECLSCHNPHHTPNASLLIESTIAELCFTCHDPDMANTEHVHGPVGAGDCTSCHDPHESNVEKMLVKEGNALCFMCHDEMNNYLDSKTNVHGALEDAGCIGCHSPHGSAHEFQLLQAVPTLCTTCHSEKGDEVLTPHGAMQEKKSCLNCHEPHAADLDTLLKKDGIALCLGCHNRRLRADDGLLTNMKTLLTKNKVHHKAFEEDGCQVCHDPHGTDRWRMLKRKFPKTFYAPFVVENYDLCFQCHDAGLAVDKLTTEATNFRNGETNLHYIHVNHPKKGRRCMVCHDPHATSEQKLIKQAAAFGNWKLPINFELQDGGGTCTPACHIPQTYKRTIFPSPKKMPPKP